MFANVLFYSHNRMIKQLHCELIMSNMITDPLIYGDVCSDENFTCRREMATIAWRIPSHISSNHRNSIICLKKIKFSKKIKFLVLHVLLAK